jgi:SWI/SNF-related matrix-associated actin-dependent regulator 1 of chromatin subfamily A
LYRGRQTRRRYEGGLDTDAKEPLTTGEGGKLVELAVGLRMLSARYDGEGFDELDALLGDALATTDAGDWTPGQARAAWKMLGKYRQRLADGGIDYSAIPEPPAEPPQAAGRDSDRAGVEAGDFIVRLGRLVPGLVGAVQRIPGVRFDLATRRALVPASPASVGPLLSFVANHGFDFSSDLVERVWEVSREREEREVASRASDADLTVEGLGGELRPFQRAGVAYALKTKRTFLADQMGLGKTVEALATVQSAGAFPALVVCPASLKLNWARETRRWLPGRSVEVLGGRGAVGQDACSEADVTIVNYDVLSKHVCALVERGFQALVLDESHYLKNYKAKRTKLCIRLSRDVPLRLLLSGTPMLNRPEELVPQLKILDRLEDLGGYRHFMRRYAGAYRTWHERHSGEGRKGEPRNLDELNRKLRATCYVRRTKEEVLKELPAKQRAVVPMELDNRGEYERALRDVVRFLGEAAENDERRLNEAVERHKAEKGEEPDAEAMRRIRARVRASAEARAERARQLVEIEALKMTAARGKLEAVTRWIEDFLQSGEKLVLFGWHRQVVDTLAERFGAPKITGNTSPEERQEAVERFQEDPGTKLLVCNVRAGGVGLTLTASSNVAFCELGWTPAEHDQAEDRCHRIGQRGSVGAWYLLAEGTIDTQIYALIEKKRAVVDAATEGVTESTGSDILSEIKELLAKGTENEEG